MLQVGDRVPHVFAVAEDGGRVDLGEADGKPRVIFFYPKPFTPVCTKEACGFRDAHEELIGIGGASVIGISRAAPEVHGRFKRELRLPYSLLSDVDGSVVRAFDVRVLGGLLPIAARVTFVIDGEGVIRGAFRNFFQAGPHIDEARRCLQQLAAQRQSA